MPDHHARFSRTVYSQFDIIIVAGPDRVPLNLRYSGCLSSVKNCAQIPCGLHLTTLADAVLRASRLRRVGRAFAVRRAPYLHSKRCIPHV